MKNVLILAVCLLISTAASAQFFTLGPKVGFSSSRFSVEEAQLVRAGNATIGFHAGAFTRLSVLGIYLQPEVLFTQAGGQIEIRDRVDDNFNQVQNLTYNKLDVPVMLGFRIGEVLRINAGPSFSLILGQDARTEGTTAEVRNNYESSTVGYQVGGGLDIGRLVLDVRYEGNLSKLGDSVQLGGRRFDTDYRNNQFSVGIGFKLL
ncbi:MAG: porin family protein [Tunicatimonas sp.]